MALFAIGVLASLMFGLGPLVAGGGFGKALGYPGLDDFIYRQAGAATTGACVGGLLALQSRRWREIRLAAVAALTFNAASAVAAIVEIAGGSAQPVAFVILAAAALVTVGMTFALQGGAAEAGPTDPDATMAWHHCSATDRPSTSWQSQVHLLLICCLGASAILSAASK